MSSIEAAIADDLLERVKKTLGYHPPVEQVDFCCSCAADDGGDGCTCDGVTAFIYWGRGDDDWTALGFDRPEVAFQLRHHRGRDVQARTDRPPGPRAADHGSGQAARGRSPVKADHDG